MGHGNAPLTPEGRRRLCERIDDGRPIAHIADEERGGVVDDGDEVELVHRYHCDPNLAFCGADLSGEDDYDYGPDDPLCVVCEELIFVDDCSVTCRLVVFS